MQAERAGKEGVSEADRRDVVRRNAAGGSDAGDALRPCLLYTSSGWDAD